MRKTLNTLTVRWRLPVDRSAACVPWISSNLAIPRFAAKAHDKNLVGFGNQTADNRSLCSTHTTATNLHPLPHKDMVESGSACSVPTVLSLARLSPAKVQSLQ